MKDTILTDEKFIDYCRTFCEEVICAVKKYLLEIKPYKLQQFIDFKEENIKDNINAGMESNVQDIVCQAMEHYMDVMCWTEKKINKKSIDIEVYNRKTKTPIIQLEIKAGINYNAPVWYLNGASQYTNVPGIFIGPIEMKEKIRDRVDKVLNIGNEFIIGYIIPQKIDLREWNVVLE